jgi:hypothetical protein
MERGGGNRVDQLKMTGIARARRGTSYIETKGFLSRYPEFQRDINMNRYIEFYRH